MEFLIISDDISACVGMRLAGVNYAVAMNRVQAAEKLREAAENPSVGIILVTPNIKRFCQNEIYEISKKNNPIIVEVPDSSGKSSFDSSGIAEYLKNTIGVTL